MQLFSYSICILLYLTASGAPGCRPAAEPEKNAPGKADRHVGGPGKPVYDLSKPNLTVSLESPALVEISGLSPGSQPGELLAIADEAGEVFFLSATDGSIRRRIPFRDRGDFEGIELVNGVIYALKSDGEIFELKNWERGPMQVNSYKTPLQKANDLEGLTFDPTQNALLLACKEDPEQSGPRNVFAFSLDTKQLTEIPVYTINPATVDSLLPPDSEDKNHAFSPSAIAVHPLRKEVYLLSTALKRMVVLDATSGKVAQVLRINKKIIPQPEGIAFDAQGNLYIASEGKNGPGILYRFDYQKPSHSK